MTYYHWEQNSSTIPGKEPVSKNIYFLPPLRSVILWFKEKTSPTDVLRKSGFYGQISAGNYVVRGSAHSSQAPTWSFKLPIRTCEVFKVESRNQSINSSFFSCETLGHTLHLSVFLLLKWGCLLPCKTSMLVFSQILTSTYNNARTQ